MGYAFFIPSFSLFICLIISFLFCFLYVISLLINCNIYPNKQILLLLLYPSLPLSSINLIYSNWTYLPVNNETSTQQWWLQGILFARLYVGHLQSQPLFLVDVVYLRRDHTSSTQTLEYKPLWFCCSSERKLLEDSGTIILIKLIYVSRIWRTFLWI